MKHCTRFLFALVVIGALCVAGAHAEPSGKSSRGSEIQARLGLSADEMARIRPMFKAYRESRRSRVDALSSKIRVLLTPEQQGRFDALIAEHEQQRASGDTSERRHGLREFISSLGLSTKQIMEVHKLVKASAEQARQEHAQLLEQVRGVLSPDQYARFEEMTRRRRGGESD